MHLSVIAGSGIRAHFCKLSRFSAKITTEGSGGGKHWHLSFAFCFFISVLRVLYARLFLLVHPEKYKCIFVANQWWASLKSISIGGITSQFSNRYGRPWNYHKHMQNDGAVLHWHVLSGCAFWDDAVVVDRRNRSKYIYFFVPSLFFIKKNFVAQKFYE